MRVSVVVEVDQVAHGARPIVATSSAGAMVWSAVYTPFGGVHSSTGILPNARFLGQRFQTESGLHQNWMRDYDPTTGRYIQADPLGLVDGASVYGYALQNPGRWVDPLGLEAAGALYWGPTGGNSAGSAVKGFVSACASAAAAPAVILSAVILFASSTPVGDGTLSDDAVCEQCSASKVDSTEHTKGKRPSTAEKHQKGQTRKGKDKGGEKGDKRRPYKRN